MSPGGIPLWDWPTVIRVRLTVCRRQGHHYALDADYCDNCGYPWLTIRL